MSNFRFIRSFPLLLVPFLYLSFSPNRFTIFYRTATNTCFNDLVCFGINNIISMLGFCRHFGISMYCGTEQPSLASSLFQDDFLAIGITDGLDELNEVGELRLVVAA